VVASVLIVPIAAAVPAARASNGAGANGEVPRAVCGPGSVPESGVQGQVPIEDRRDGRSAVARSCNLALLGQYQGEGASWVSASYQHCAYMSSAYPGTLMSKKPGVRVLDVSDPRHPVLTAVVSSPAMAGGTWESLKVNVERGLLAGVAGGTVLGVGLFDVYDVKTDCAHPKLLSSLTEPRLSMPANGLGHEGDWSPDGRTYWSTGLGLGAITAIDVAQPAHPRILWSGTSNVSNHGLSISADGNRLYEANLEPAGVDIFDISSIQSRSGLPGLRFVGQYLESLDDGKFAQHSIPFTKDGKPYLISVDEAGQGGVRILDISNEASPTVVRKIRLQIQLPENQRLRDADADGNGVFAYQSHYCTLDRAIDPTALACGYFQSGIRVFDVRDLANPREVAYFNPAAQVGKAAMLPDSEHAVGLAAQGPQTVTDGIDAGGGGFSAFLANLANARGLPNSLSADWCSSPPAFVRGQLWVTCQDNGFLALRFTNGAYPLG
jgi:hypothetical protein